jgi:hypothetical protein
MDSGDRTHRLAYVYAAVAVVFWATSASAFKLSLQHLGVVPLLLVASVTSAAALLVYLVLTGTL